MKCKNSWKHCNFEYVKIMQLFASSACSLVMTTTSLALTIAPLKSPLMLRKKPLIDWAAKNHRTLTLFHKIEIRLPHSSKRCLFVFFTARRLKTRNSRSISPSVNVILQNSSLVLPHELIRVFRELRMFLFSLRAC